MSDKPVTQSEDFIAELEQGKMDFRDLYDKQFIVAVSTGDRNACKLLASTIHGPFDFAEMVEAVGTMYRDEQHHAKVTILDKKLGFRAKFLDEGTTDMIESDWENIIFEVTFESELAVDKPIKAGILEGDDSTIAEEIVGELVDEQV